MNETIKKIAKELGLSTKGLAEKLNMSFDDLAKMDPKNLLGMIRENMPQIWGPGTSMIGQSFEYGPKDFDEWLRQSADLVGEIFEDVSGPPVIDEGGAIEPTAFQKLLKHIGVGGSDPSIILDHDPNTDFAGNKTGGADPEFIDWGNMDKTFKTQLIDVFKDMGVDVGHLTEEAPGMMDMGELINSIFTNTGDDKKTDVFNKIKEIASKILPQEDMIIIDEEGAHTPTDFQKIIQNIGNIFTENFPNLEDFPQTGDANFPDIINDMITKGKDIFEDMFGEDGEIDWFPTGTIPEELSDDINKGIQTVKDLASNLGNIDLSKIDLNEMFKNVPQDQITNLLSTLTTDPASVNQPATEDRFDFGWSKKAPKRAKNRRKLIDFIKKLGTPQEGYTESGFTKGPGPLLQGLFGKTSKALTDVDEMAEQLGIDISQFTGKQLKDMRKLLKSGLPEGTSIGDLLKGDDFSNLANQLLDKKNPLETSTMDVFNKIKGGSQILQGLLSGNPLSVGTGLSDIFTKDKILKDARNLWMKNKREEILPGIAEGQIQNQQNISAQDIASNLEAAKLHSKEDFMENLEWQKQPSRFTRGGKIPSTLSPYLSESYKRYLRGGQAQKPTRSYRGGGMVSGPSHARGGVKFNVGGQVHELEGGEAVINKKSTAMFKDILSKINQAGGGKRFAGGGMVRGGGLADKHVQLMLNRIGRL
tara:strand:- start:5291 stop:7393 length:2103 start_codon:yes stop_codon:yes gene_type:complete